MGNALVSAMCIALMLVSILMMTQSTFSSVDLISQSWKSMEARSGNFSRTDIADLGESSCTGSDVTITIENRGGVSITDFDEWDVIVQYYAGVTPDYEVAWLVYDSASPPADNKWTVEGIYLDASASSAEIFEPNIFNPGEEMKISIKLNPAVAASTTNMVTVSTPTGITAQAMFSGP